MDDVKTHLDKIMAEFNNSITHSAPKKLSFDHLNDSFNDSGTVPKKRRISQSSSDDPQVNGNGSSCNLSTSTLNTSVPPSPWETRRIKADLIDAKTRINHLKHEIERLQRLHSEKETLSKIKVDELIKQSDFSCSKIADLEKHMQLVRQREQMAKQSINKLQKELNEQKHSYEEALHNMQRSRTDLENEARHVQTSLTNELSEYRRHADRLEMELEATTNELSKVRKLYDECRGPAAAYDKLKLEHFQQQHTLEVANTRIKELENQIGLYADWKHVTKVSQTTLLNMPDLEHELNRLRENNKRLQQLIGNKLLLEEQVHDLSTRLEKEEGGRTEAVALQVKLTHIEQELKEWEKVAQDHCLPNVPVSALALRARIEQILQKDIILSSETDTNRSENRSIESTLQDYKQKSEIYAKNIEELNVALKRHKIFKDRVQRKLLLVSKERDCYKQLLENFEKDLTISNGNNTTEHANPELQLHLRLDMLEKTLIGYKDMCANLEKELTNAKQLSTADQSIETAMNCDSFDHIKRELDSLRLENERLRRRKEVLEMDLEHRYLKGVYSTGNTKVVHLAKNPASEAYANFKLQIEKLQAEIERLKRRNQKLQEDSEATQARHNDTTANMTMNIKEVNTMRAELESTISKMKKMKECYKSASMEFREVCYMLFGYRIDRIGLNTNYKLSSMYAESPDDYLNFRLNESNVLDMLETPYSLTLRSLIEDQLVDNKSLPAFLSSLTLDLFQRSTVTMS